VTIVLATKPGINGANTLSIPTAWDATWFRKFIANSLQGADVRNAVGAGGIKVTGNISSPYATIGFSGPVTLPVPVGINGPGTTGSTGASLTVYEQATGYAIDMYAPSANAGVVLGGFSSAGAVVGYLDFISGTGGYGGATETLLMNDGATVNDYLTLGAGGTRRIFITGTGETIIDGGSGSGLFALQINGGASNEWTVAIYNPNSATGTNYGLLIEAGSNASDFGLAVLNKGGAADLFTVAGNGSTRVFGPLGVNSNTAPTQITGFGTPTGNAVVANFPGATATLVQCSESIAEILVILKQIGFIGA